MVRFLWASGQKLFTNWTTHDFVLSVFLFKRYLFNTRTVLIHEHWIHDLQCYNSCLNKAFVAVHTKSCPTLCDPMDTACQASLSFSISLSLLKFMSIELMMPSNHLILCCPLLLLPSIFPSIRVFFSESVLPIRWPKYQSFSFSSSPFNEYSGLISFRINWFDLPAVQGTLKSLLQHHSSKAPFFGAQHSLGSNSHIRTWLMERP